MRFEKIERPVRLLCALALLSPLTFTETRAQRKRSVGKTPASSATAAGGSQGQKSGQNKMPEGKGAKEASEIVSAITIRWRGQAGVERYRLQVARDQAFSDVLFDQAVSGRQHTLNLPPGSYFWRVAPAVRETGTYSDPQSFNVARTQATIDEQRVVVEQGANGWRTATGEIPHLVSARLREGSGLDLVGANTDGTVYALDGANGVALWTARYNLSARRGEENDKRALHFQPLIVETTKGASDVAVGFHEGLRLLRGQTGKEIWRASFEGRAQTGTIADLDGDGVNEIALTTREPSTLIVINSIDGKVVSKTSLDANVVGAPALFLHGDQREIVLGLSDGRVEVRNAQGKLLRSGKIDGLPTTGPLVVHSTRTPLLVVGGQKGLTAMNPADLKNLGFINTADDSPRGVLKASDIDGDGSLEIVMVTRGGRVALIGTSDGNIRWVSEGAQDADSAALADLNGDGALDVIVAAGSSFAHGYSGKDGALIWRVGDDVGGRAAAPPTQPLPRTLVIALSANDGAYLVGGDTSRVGLRAVELPRDAVKTAVR